MKTRAKLVNERYFTNEDSGLIKAFKLIADSLNDECCIAIDTETSGLSPIEDQLCVVQMATEEQIVIIQTKFLSERAKQRLCQFISNPKYRLIAHNAKFDLEFLKQHLKIKDFPKVFCTMIASQIIACGDKTVRHSLKETVEREFPTAVINKDEQVSNWAADILTESQINYACQDVLYLIDLRKRQIEQIRKLKMMKICQYEMEFVEVNAELELNGIKLDFEKWMCYANRMRLRAIRMKEKISQMLFPQQGLFAGAITHKVTTHELKIRLKELGVKLPTKKSKDGEEKETLDADYLEKIKDSHAVIPLMLKHSTYEKSWTSYGENWKCKILSDGRIHETFKQIGTETGRMSSGLHTIPREAMYRRCFVPEKGNSFIYADYSQCELRIAADFSGDLAMKAAFESGKDLHTYTASLIFNVKFDDVDKLQRQRAKNLNFGVVYGIGARRFAANAEIPEHEAELLMKNYFKTYKHLYQWLQHQKEIALIEKQVRTISGRVIKLFYDSENFGQVSEAQRNACNAPIQGTNADILKRACRLIRNERLEDYKFILLVHDETVGECQTTNAENYSRIIVSKMVEAYNEIVKFVPVKVDATIAQCYGK